MKRYRVYPIGSADCNSINPLVLILETDDIEAAKRAANEHSYHPFGTGIEDTQEGTLDVGFGFGVPCPDVEV